MMGGALSVKSELGKGSTFAMTLPLQGIERPSTVTSLPSEGFSQFRGRVLVVDDGEDARRLARELLMGLGVHVETVDDGEQALARLERGKFDLVFMDCQMPKLNGYDATREIRRREGDEQHTTIVALSASVLPDERAHCAEAGMDDYVAKPFSGQDLARVLRRWLPAATLG
jgi:CheY-like chemotaxis protein